MKDYKRLIFVPNPESQPEAYFFYKNTPADFHSWRAFDLFTAAVQTGIFQWKTHFSIEEFHNSLLTGKPLRSTLFKTAFGPIKTNTHLAYWCALASYYLGLDRGGHIDRRTGEKKPPTPYWKPFETLFGLPEKTLSRATGPLDLDRNEEDRPIAREDYAAEIDAFFDNLETDLDTENQP